MKKFVSVLSLMVAMGVFVASTLLLTRFEKSVYIEGLSDEKVNQIEKVVNNPTDPPSTDIQLHYDFNPNIDFVDLKELNKEYENQNWIIRDSRDLNYIVLGLCAVLFFTNLYFLILNFQKKKTSQK